MTAVNSHIALDVSAGVMDKAGTGVYTMRLAEALSGILGSSFSTLACPIVRPRQSPRTLPDRVMTLRHDIWWIHYGCERAAAKGAMRQGDHGGERW